MSNPDESADEDGPVDTDPADDPDSVDIGIAADPTAGDDPGSVDTDPTVGDDPERIQLIVSRESDRAALANLLDDRYTVVVDDELQAVDGYLIGDRILPAYREAIRAIKADKHPEFCPVLVISRPELADTVADLLEAPESPRPLVDEVVTAPVDRPTLYRRLRNLLIRRRQSVELADRIKTTERRFQQLFDSTNDALFVIDERGEAFLECNPAACELTGYERETLCSMSPARIFDHDDWERFQPFFDAVQRTNSGWTNELTCLTSDGGHRLLEVSAATLEESERPPVVVSARDITDRKRYQEELELRSEAIEGAPIGISITDSQSEDNPLVYVNRGFESITGYNRAEILGRNCRFLQGEETSEEAVAELRTAIEAEKPVTVELRNYRKDGSPFWNRVTVAPVYNDDDELIHFIGFQEDVSDRKKREQQLTLFRRAVENTAQAVFITDREGHIVYANPAFETQTGYSRTEVNGFKPHILKSGKQEEAFYEELWETILSGETWEAELVNQRNSGELYHVSQSIAPITDEDGTISHFVAIERDITDRRHNEQQLNVLNRVLRHNLRNGLNVIQGNANLLSSSVAEDLQRFVQPIETRAESLSRLSRKVGTIESMFSQQPTEEISSDLESVFVELEGAFESRHPGATLSMSVGDVPPIRADNRLQAALSELLDNAVVHNTNDEPKVWVSVTTPTDNKDDEWVAIEICDNGPGIPEHETRVLQEGTETPLEHATGLGLWLAYWTTSLFGGDIAIESTDTGTCVTLLLPRADSE